MKRILSIMTLIAVLWAVDARAQFTVEDSPKEKVSDVKFKPSQLKSLNTSTDYYSEARAKVERIKLRRERNTFTATIDLQGTMASYNEAHGGDNSLAVQATFTFNHTYKRGLFSLVTSGNFRYGYNRLKVENEEGELEGIWYKNLDQFWVQTQPGRQINNKWKYTATLKIDSQLTKTYRSRTAQTDDDITKAFFAPANINLSVGLTYASPNKKFPINISLNPLSTSGTVVYNDDLKRIYESQNKTSYFGVDIDKHATFSGGSSTQINFSRSWGKTKWLSYTLKVDGYYGWITNVMRNSKIKEYEKYLADKEAWEAGGSQGEAPKSVPRFDRLHPTVTMQNTINLKLAKYLTTKFYHRLDYDKAANTAVKMYSTLTLGFSYTFHSKK